MSLQPHADGVIPAETARIARAIFVKGNLYLQVFDTFGPLFQDQEFAALFAHDGQPAASPARLAIVLMLQFIEGLPDRQAADAVRTRIDWKYLLGLELTDPGFHHSVLSEFRARLVAGSQEEFLLNKLLAHFQEHGLRKARSRQRTDSTHVLGAIRGMTRLACVGETLRAALNALAVAAPDWLRTHSQPAWVDR
jgi:transposase